MDYWGGGGGGGGGQSVCWPPSQIIGGGEGGGPGPPGPPFPTSMLLEHLLFSALCLNCQYCQIISALPHHHTVIGLHRWSYFEWVKNSTTIIV